MAPIAEPTHIYKLVPPSGMPTESASELDSTDWVLADSAVDTNSGFIHFSTAAQVPNTLKRFFASDARVYVLRLPYAPLTQRPDGRVQWDHPETHVCGDRPEEGTFPHLYAKEGAEEKGGEKKLCKLGRKDVDGWKVLEQADGGFEKALDKARAEGWLI